MKKSALFFLFILISFLGSAQKKNELPKTLDDTLAILAEFQKEMRKALVEEFKPSATIKRNRLDDDALPQEIPAAKAAELNKLFTSSFFFRPSPFSGEQSQVMVEFDNFFYPGPSVVEYKISWLKALDRNNKDHLSPEELNASNSWTSVTYGGQKFLKLKDTFQNKITKLEAEIVIKLPSKLNIKALDKSQINKAFMIGSIPAKLINIDNDFAAVWIGEKYDNFQLIPFNANNQAIDVTSNTSFVFMADKESIKELKLPKDLGPGSLMFIKANGVIHRVDLYERAESTEYKNKVTIMPKPILTNGLGNVSVDQYQKLIPKDFTNLKTVDGEKIKSSAFEIKKIINEWDKSVSYRMECQLPNDNFLMQYADVSLVNVKYYNKKKLVKEVEEDGFYSTEDFLIYSTPQNEEYNPLEIDEAIGEVKIKYPAKITTTTFKRADEKVGISTITGNKLTLNMDVLTDVKDILGESSLQVLRAYGKSTVFPLKKDSYYNAEFKNDKSLEHQFYLGNITSVQMDLPSEWTEISFPFKASMKPVKATKKK